MAKLATKRDHARSFAAALDALDAATTDVCQAVDTYADPTREQVERLRQVVRDLTDAVNLADE